MLLAGHKLWEALSKELQERKAMLVDYYAEGCSNLHCSSTVLAHFTFYTYVGVRPT